jgi:ketosteroid isomerase-like protein
VTAYDHQALSEAELRAAERELEAALESDDRTAWVYAYAEDAVFDAGGDHAAEGRAALLAMASAMRPLSNVSIRPLRSEVSGDLAAVWCEASWVSGFPPDARAVKVRGVMVWRRDSDGQWRVALEHIA